MHSWTLHGCLLGKLEVWVADSGAHKTRYLLVLCAPFGASAWDYSQKECSNQSIGTWGLFIYAVLLCCQHTLLSIANQMSQLRRDIALLNFIRPCICR